MLRSVHWQLVNDVSGKPVSPILKGQAVCVADRSVTNYQSTQRNIPEERRSYLRRGGSLKSSKAMPPQDAYYCPVVCVHPV